MTDDHTTSDDLSAVPPPVPPPDPSSVGAAGSQDVAQTPAASVSETPVVPVGAAARVHHGDGPEAGGAPEAGKPPAALRLARRRFLQAALATGGTAAALGVLGGVADAFAGTPASQTAPADAAHQWAMVIDLRQCNGCKLCTAACQKYHCLHEDQTWINVFTMKSAVGDSYFMPRPCMMCEEPACVPVCPVSANFRTPEGLTLVDQDRCVGTRICMNACPYQARYFNWGDPVPAPRQPVPRQPSWPVPQEKGTVGKCVFCAAMLPMGKLPECVSYCPMGVIYIGDLVTDTAVNGMGKKITLSTFLKQNNAVRFKEEYGTSPRVWYIPGDGQNLDLDTATEA